MQLDLARVAERTGLPADEVIRLHQQAEYTVYAIGFCPGFPYLGYLPPPLCGVPRLEKPRIKVEAGSVGMTERQTGIYTEPRPGGWNIIGRAPLELVHVADGYFPLRNRRSRPIRAASMKQIIRPPPGTTSAGASVQQKGEVSMSAALLAEILKSQLKDIRSRKACTRASAGFKARRARPSR